MKVTIRKFAAQDIPQKLKWINDPRNNRYLHYDLPLEQKKTEQWFQRVSALDDRLDCVIEADGVPCGLIGLLNIDRRNRKAELYLTLGEPELRGKGISLQAVRQLLEQAFGELALNRVYLYTETENIPAQRLFEKIGFHREGVFRADLFYRERWVERCVYAILKDDYI